MTNTIHQNTLRRYLRLLFSHDRQHSTIALRERWKASGEHAHEFREVMYQLAAQQWICPAPGVPGRVELTRAGRSERVPAPCRLLASPMQHGIEVDYQAALAALRAQGLKVGMRVDIQRLSGHHQASLLEGLRHKGWVSGPECGPYLLTPAGHRACWTPAKGLDENHTRWMGDHLFKTQMSASPARHCIS